MSLLTIARGLALNVGMSPPSMVMASASREGAEIRQFAGEVGEELARRVQWGDLTRTVTMAGSGALPVDFDRLVEGVCVTSTAGIVRPLTQAEWTMPAATGAPRYFLLRDTELTLWPEGPANVTYQSKNWVGGVLDGFTDDGQSPVMDEALFLKALIVRWRRQKGMPYTDEEAEYEAALGQYAANDDRGRL